jgi:hypothetical protein
MCFFFSMRDQSCHAILSPFSFVNHMTTFFQIDFKCTIYTALNPVRISRLKFWFDTLAGGMSQFRVFLSHAWSHTRQAPVITGSFSLFKTCGFNRPSREKGEADRTNRVGRDSIGDSIGIQVT